MSSPGDRDPPPDPPAVPETAQAADTPQASQSTPPPNPTSPAPRADNNPASGDDPAPNGRRRPLSSLSFFYPYPFRPGEQGETNENGERVGLQWTLEVFANDGGDEQDDDGSGAPGPMFAPFPPPPNEADAEAPQADAAGTGGEGQTGQGANPGQQGNNRPHDPPRSVFFIVGPDGRLLPRPGADQDMGPPPIWPFFPWGMSSAPPAPDPAKAAELIASLPTVGRALLRRVDKVVAAEDANIGKEYDDRGWRCGICLEGMDGPEELAENPKPRVKALPCNHLFHEDCVQPWFTSHHTCPTCRLDLDPLQTLHPPRETRRNPLRPTATGSGRATPAGHPYARDRTEARSRPGSAQPSRPETPATAPGTEGSAPPPTAERRTAMNLFDAALDMALGNFGRSMASPVPMTRPESEDASGGTSGATSAAPEAAPAAPTGPTPANAPPRPTPERRRHITVITIPPPAASPPPPDAANTPASAPTDPAAAPGASAASPAPPAADAAAGAPGAPPLGHPPITSIFPFDLFFLGPRPPNMAADEPAANPDEPAPPPFVPQSLESWTELREKNLGWRCDAIDCLIAPPIPDNSREDTMDLDVAEDDADETPAADKEMLSIYAPTQPPFPPRAAGEGPSEDQDFVLLACEHRWHRCCLETAERSAGHSLDPDAQGRGWIRCQKCRKEGWIVPRIAA